MTSARTGLLLAAAAAAACARGLGERPSAPVAPPRSATLEEVRAAYDAYCNGISTISASGDLDVRDQRTGKSQKLGIRLLAARGGRLYIKGSVAIVTALELSSDGARFWFQVPSKKTVWTGSNAAGAQSERDEAPYFALRPGDVVPAFLPEPLKPLPGEVLVFEADRESFSLALARLAEGAGRVRRRVHLRRESLEWSGSRSFDEQGELTSEVSVAGWSDGRPRQVRIERPVEGYSAAFALEKLEANVRVPERAFVPRSPEGYKVIEVP